MFSISNFLKLLLVILLVTLSAQTPFAKGIVDLISSLAGGGPFGTAVSSACLFIIFWFLVSKAFDFIAFTFGGGVGRYSTTKIYRRIQWLTFILAMSVPTLGVVTLIFTATPWSENSQTYLDEVKRVQDERRQAAITRQLEQLREAEEERSSNIRTERFRLSRAYDEAVAAREEQIAKRRTELKEEIEAEIEARADYQRFTQQRETLTTRSTAIIEKYSADSYDIDTYKAQARAYLDAIAAKYNIRLEEQDRANVLGGPTSAGLILVGTHISDECKALFEVRNFPTARARATRTGKACFVSFMLTRFQSSLGWLELEASDFSELDAIARDYRTLIELVPQGMELDAKIAEIKAKYEDDLKAAAEYTEPTIRRSEYEIDLSDFPQKSARDFPLRIDQSPIIAEDPYIERIDPTFEKHFWWMLPLAILIWVGIQNDGRAQISAIYSAIARVLMDQGRFGYGGSARFATMFEEWGKEYSKGSLYMGKSLFGPFSEIGLKGEAHMLTIAGSRGGKGSSAIIPNLLLWEGSAVVIDPKGTNAHVTAEARRKMGQNVHIIDPFGVVTKDSARFDPLDGLDPDDELVRERIASIADALVVIKKDAKDPHWDEGARTFIAGMISQLISQDDDDKWLHKIRDMIRQLPDQQDEIWAEMALNERAGEYAKDAAIRYIRGSETNEILSIMSSADKHTEWLSSAVMRRITSNPTFKLQELKSKPTTVYLVIPPRQIKRHKRLIRLFVNLMIETVERGGKSPTPILMIIDEFASLGKMEEFPEAFATMASYNLFLWPFLQSMGQLQELYGEEADGFEASSRAIQVFSVDDKTTREFISDKLGSRPLSGLGSIARSNENVLLRSPNDVGKDIAADAGRQYIIERGKSPMLIQRVPYFKSGKFKRKAGRDPDYK